MSGAAKKSAVGTLHSRFQDLLAQELDMYLGLAQDEDGNAIPPMPMAAADKSVFLAWFKLNDITAEPDTTDASKLKEQFQEVIKEKRDKRASQLVADDGDAMAQFTH